MEFVWTLVKNYYFDKYIMERNLAKHWFLMCDLALGHIDPSILQTVAEHKNKVHALIPMLYRKNPSYASEIVNKAEAFVVQYGLY